MKKVFTKIMLFCLMTKSEKHLGFKPLGNH